MAKSKKSDLVALGAQYREARGAVAVHRRRQAAAELEHGRLVRRLGPGHPDVETAREAVASAHTDVQWCRGLVVACGEAYKDIPFNEVPHDRAVIEHARNGALAGLTGEVR